MMALPWVRLDTAFPTNPKVLMLVEDKKWQSIAVYVASLAYSGAHGTDGFVPENALIHLHGSKRNAKDLVDVGLWIGVQGGYEINGWAEFQPSTEEHAARRKRARAAAEARWQRRNGRT